MDAPTKLEASTLIPPNTRIALLCPEDLRRLSAISSWVPCCKILLDWTTILITIFSAVSFQNIAVYALSVFVIAGRIHALLVLMHESVHYRIHSNKKINDLISNIFCAWPAFITTEGFRRNHFEHHRYVNTDKDPDWVRKNGNEWRFPMEQKKLVGIFLRDIFGLTTIKMIREIRNLSRVKQMNDGRHSSTTRLCFYALLSAIITWQHLWLYIGIYWIIPIFTALPLFIRVRGISEHLGLRDGDLIDTRTVVPSFVDKLFFCPNNISYHIEHHLYPSIPFFRLRTVHKILKQNRIYNEKAHVTYSCYNMIKECCT